MDNSSVFTTWEAPSTRKTISLEQPEDGENLICTINAEKQQQCNKASKRQIYTKHVEGICTDRIIYFLKHVMVGIRDRQYMLKSLLCKLLV